MGLPKGPEGQGLPEVRTTLSLTVGVPGRGPSPASGRLSGPGLRLGRPAPFLRCVPGGQRWPSTLGAEQVPQPGQGRGQTSAAPGSPGTEAGFHSPLSSSTQSRAPRGSGSRLSRPPELFAPTPGAAGLALRPGAAAPWSHETRAGTVPARVVQRAVTLWRLPPPLGARGVPMAGLTRLGVCRASPPPDPGSRRKFASRARSGLYAGDDPLSGGAAWPGRAPGGRVAASSEPSGHLCFLGCY